MATGCNGDSASLAATTLRRDQDVVEWFKGDAPEGGYQTEISRVLRR